MFLVQHCGESSQQPSHFTFGNELRVASWRKTTSCAGHLLYGKQIMKNANVDAIIAHAISTYVYNVWMDVGIRYGWWCPAPTLQAPKGLVCWFVTGCSRNDL